jgi:hypothetical protein
MLVLVRQPLEIKSLNVNNNDSAYSVKLFIDHEERFIIVL